MAGLSSALNAAKTSLEVNQKTIEVIGNNISNVNTEGYSRQQTVLETYPSLNFGDFFVGQGVKITDVSRQHDVFVEGQIQEKAAEFGYQEAMSSPLSELERIFSVTEDNLSSDIDTFFDSLSELSADPSDLVQRNNVILQGNVLADSFNDIMDNLDSVADDINNTLASDIDSLNSKFVELADLNDRIFQIEIHGQTANSARDERESLIKDLAMTIGAETYETENGMVSVQLPNGLPLVEGTMAMTITSETVGSDLVISLEAGGVTRELSESSFGGQFKGLMELRDSFIPELEDGMDQLAYELSVQINLQHMAGAGLDSSTDNLFFDMPPNYIASPPADSPTATEYEGAARAMNVAITDPNQIAAAAAPDSSLDSVAQGDNRNALLLANIGSNYLVNGTDSFTSLYGQMTAKVGVESNQNELSLSGAEDALVQLENLRDGLSGVSLEEEMINLIQFQRGFESAAKFLSTIDEMMTTILSIKQ
ncbi:MAG: flagellar hook-associated protein 1 FlgK [Desulforhopalus sp.]|jgi:flagellar hook-associated protein 1 FlgK